MFLLWSCDSHPLPSYTPNTTYEIQTRGILTTTSSLPEGSQALFNASGGILITNNVYTYDGHSWKNNDIIQTSSATETTLTALYPAYNEANNFITQNPYTTDRALEDVLMAQAVFTDQTNIELEFHHLFSLLTIHVQDELNETLSVVSLKAPKVDNINPISGDISISDEHTTLLNKNTIGEYSFIVPPSANANIVLTFRFTDNEVSHQLTHTFLKGNKYECNVIKADDRPGIRNASDLIAFAELINKEHKGKRSLSEFGEQEGSTMVYRLLADIILTEEDCQKLIPIGNHSSTPFNDTFDGEGHTISNLQFKAYQASGGLFSKVESSGIVKNLYIENSFGPIKKGSYGTGIGFVAGLCYGTINNCHVTNSKISNEESTNTGGIAGLLTGKIINCSVRNTKIESTEGACGVVIGRLSNGQIINSYSYQDSISGKSNYRGGIAGYSENSSITNCYVYKNNFNSNKTYKGLFIGSASKTTINNCYHNPSTTMDIIYNMPNNCTLSSIYEFTANFTTTINDSIIPIYILLNKWVEEQNSNIFKIWTIAPDGSPCFE